MTPEQINNLIQWMERTASGIAYGSVIVEIVRHDNHTRHIVKTVSEKVRPDNEG